MTSTWTKEQYKAYREQEKKKTKYLARKTKIDGITFDSQKEADYYHQLKNFMNVKAIKGFARQVQFILVEGNDNERAITYKADFVVFYENETEVVDIKGFRESKEWKRTYKLFKLKFPDLELKII
jgi:hypothetical protein